MGAGSITSNVKSNKTDIVKRYNESINTGMRKIGAILDDYIEVGCNSVLNRGTIIGKNFNIYLTCCIGGVVPARSIYKTDGTIIEKI